MTVLHIIHGAPGAGKTTFARELAARTGATIVCMDALIDERFKGERTKRNRARAANLRNEELKRGLRSGSVISADTNLRAITVQGLAAIARDYGAAIEQHYVECSPELLRSRNENRPERERIPAEALESIIRKSYEGERLRPIVIGETSSFVVRTATPESELHAEFNRECMSAYPPLSRGVVAVDLDGTLVNNAHVADKAFGDKPFDYKAFERSYGEAPVNPYAAELVLRLRDSGVTCYVLTGRSRDGIEGTLSFLRHHRIPLTKLLMKPQGDFRPDFEFKRAEAARLAAEGTPFIHALDDRPRVVSMWSSLGMLPTVFPYHEPNPLASFEPYPPSEPSTIIGSGYCFACGRETTGLAHKKCLAGEVDNLRLK